MRKLIATLMLLNLLLIGGGQALASNGRIGLPSAEELFGDRDGVTTQEERDRQDGVDSVRGESEFSDDEFDEETGRRQVAVPRGDLISDILPGAIRLTLYLMGVLLFAVFTYAGIRLLIARGDEEDLGKAKDMLIHILIGAAIVGGSFALVTGALRVLSNL